MLCHTRDCGPSLISVLGRDVHINFDKYTFYPEEGRWRPRNRVIERVLLAEKLQKGVGPENRKAQCSSSGLVTVGPSPSWASGVRADRVAEPEAEGRRQHRRARAEPWGDSGGRI